MKNILKTFFIGMIALSIISCSEDEIIEPQMVYVEGGTFMMGCTAEQGSDCEGSEKPAHSVTLSSFKISKYEITQEQYESVMGENPNSLKCDNCPIEGVNWYDAQEFCERLSDATGKQYRLPTEAEWEYAARGGNKSKGYKYSGSNNLNNVGWYEGGTHPVGQKMPNELGIYDISGNVCEWCRDWYGSYPEKEQINPMGPSTGSSRVFRGGNWIRNAPDCRVAIRDRSAPGDSGYTLGFRVVCS
jgi:formylglycine-generating enzyme required for sulfatase activity